MYNILRFKLSETIILNVIRLLTNMIYVWNEIYVSKTCSHAKQILLSAKTFFINKQSFLCQNEF